MQPFTSPNDGNANPYREPPPPPPLPAVSAIDAYKFAFDPEGGLTTILFATLCLFIPIVGPIVLKGYEADILQRLVRRDGVTFPKFEFDKFSSYLTRGVSTFVVELLVGVPVMFVMMFVMGGMMFGWTAIAPPDASHSGSPPASLVALLFTMPVVAGAALLAFSVVFNAAITRAALTEEIGAALDLKQIAAYARRMFLPTMAAMIVFGFLAMAAFFIGVLAFFICAYPMLVVTQIAFTHVRFQLYERYVAMGGAPIPVKPLALPPYGGGPGYGPPGYSQQGYGGYQPPPNAQGYPPPRYPGQ